MRRVKEKMALTNTGLFSSAAKIRAINVLARAVNITRITYINIFIDILTDHAISGVAFVTDTPIGVTVGLTSCVWVTVLIMQCTLFGLYAFLSVVVKAQTTQTQI